MRVSQWIRQYQLSGEVPESDDIKMAFWTGWLMGRGSIARPHHVKKPFNLDDERDMAIRAAEYIESRARD